MKFNCPAFFAFITLFFISAFCSKIYFSTNFRFDMMETFFDTAVIISDGSTDRLVIEEAVSNNLNNVLNKFNKFKSTFGFVISTDSSGKIASLRENGNPAVLSEKMTEMIRNWVLSDLPNSTIDIFAVYKPDMKMSEIRTKSINYNHSAPALMMLGVLGMLLALIPLLLLAQK